MFDDPAAFLGGVMMGFLAIFIIIILAIYIYMAVALMAIAKKLKGKKITHINATASGGGVAEILDTLVPLMDCIGINAKWFFINL